MRRRDFITLIGGAAAASFRHQVTRTVRYAQDFANSVGSKAGSILIEFRWAEGDCERLPAGKLFRLNVDALVTHGAAGALAAKNATSAVPIVITAVGDMITLGLVSNLSRPGGRIIAFRCGAYG